jgi:MFS family permease
MNAILQQLKSSKLMPYLVCITASLFFAYELMQLHMLGAISPILMKELNMNAQDFGLLCSTYLIADVLFLLPAGLILDRFSIRKVILASMALAIASAMAFACASNFWQASVAHFFAGIGNGFCFLSCMILISQWFKPQRQALMTGVCITIGMLGGVLAQSPFSILASNYGFRAALYIDAIIGVVVFCLIALFVHDKKQKFVAEPFVESLKLACSNLQNTLIGVFTGLLNLPLMILSAIWGGLFLTQVYQIPLTQASLIVSMICMGSIVGSPLFGWLSDKIASRKGIIRFGNWTTALFMCSFAFIENPSILSLFCIFFAIGFFCSTHILGYPLITANNPKEITGSAMGLAAVIIMGLPAILGPVTGNLMKQSWSLHQTMQGGVPLYTKADFFYGLCILPLSLVIGEICLFFTKEHNQKETQVLI